MRTTADGRPRDLGVGIALALTFSTGIVDAVSYFSLDHVFTANMSGNMALLGVGIATDFGVVAGNAFAFAGFALGSVLVGRFMRARPGSAMGVASAALSIELALLVVVVALLAAIDTHVHDGWRYAVCLVLAMAMGVQTGVARRLGVADVNTTVATMTLHDLAAASPPAGGASERWRRRLAVVLALLVGAAVGVGLDTAARWGGLTLSCLIVAATIVVARSQRSD